MSKKRMFQILDELNQMDVENNTKNVILLPDLTDVSAGKINGKVTIGVPAEIAQQLMNQSVFGGNKLSAILMVIDKEEYNKIANQ